MPNQIIRVVLLGELFYMYKISVGFEKVNQNYIFFSKKSVKIEDFKNVTHFLMAFVK